ncbi:hypothetical protein WN51_05023 [Melipona quadrifasciata]|uniref:Uncharacterized protein n=1 Tax=Melipona quadrifasciata TaxID=166423 RepID=A0A0N0BD05_9HYME|nr:hypothetical protein WN51_05023 [Melipona quadrifasciata]
MAGMRFMHIVDIPVIDFPRRNLVDKMSTRRLYGGRGLLRGGGFDPQIHGRFCTTNFRALLRGGGFDPQIHGRFSHEKYFPLLRETFEFIEEQNFATQDNNNSLTVTPGPFSETNRTGVQVEQSFFHFENMTKKLSLNSLMKEEAFIFKPIVDSVVEKIVQLWRINLVVQGDSRNLR